MRIWDDLIVHIFIENLNKFFSKIRGCGVKEPQTSFCKELQKQFAFFGACKEFQKKFVAFWSVCKELQEKRCCFFVVSIRNYKQKIAPLRNYTRFCNSVQPQPARAYLYNFGRKILVGGFIDNMGNFFLGSFFRMSIRTYKNFDT